MADEKDISSPHRVEKDACLNNLKLNFNLACTSTRERNHPSNHSKGVVEHLHRNRHRDKLLQGSLENVSTNPLGEYISQESSLRRCRSLAISREDIFTSLEIPSSTQSRRSQLIPRAKLIDRTSFKDRCLINGRSQDNLLISECILLKRKTSVTSEVAVSQQNINNPQRRRSSVSQIRKPDVKESPFIHINSFPTRFRSEIDSLDSNYQNKTSPSSVCRLSPETSTYSEEGLSLPNYYPGSKRDTDASVTDIVSLCEEKWSKNLLVNNEELPDKSSKKVDKKENCQSSDSIPYDENIVLSKNTPLYDSISDFSCSSTKPLYKLRTIRGNTPYYRENESYYSGKPRSLPICNTTGGTTYDSDSTLSDYNLKNYEPGKSNDEKDKSEYVESDTNFDEIKLSNENIKLVHKDKVTENVIYDSKSECSNVETNPVYEGDNEIILNDNISSKVYENHEEIVDREQSDTIKAYSSLPHINLIVPSNELKSISSRDNTTQADGIKTSVKVKAADDINLVGSDITNSEEYKTVVSVDTDYQSSLNLEQYSPQEAKKHSHNYLREFLESQKGSRKPLQNFLSKKISRAFGDRNLRQDTNKNSNLTDNQYHSLPDITISKNLRKCDKIDRKLRKSENQKINKPQTDTTNRFIVNIGRHFDVTAQSNIPVDFEVKISKIRKPHTGKEKSKGQVKDQEVEEKSFLEAVKSLKKTLNGIDENQNISKPEIVAVHKKLNTNEQVKQNCVDVVKSNNDQIVSDRITNAKTNCQVNESEKELKGQQSNMEKSNNSIDKEYQEKVGTVRSYWDKMINEATEKSVNNFSSNGNENREGVYRCKIVDVQTKVEDVKKKFEGVEDNSCEKQQQSKVQLAKQMFETKPKNEKNGKVSNYIKECREIFENPFFERDHSNQFESLNPNIVEIIEREEKMKAENLDNGREENNTEINNKKQHKPVGKSKSVTSEPEFDHVRYRVMKSDVFQKKIFANCDRESQFDGLMQYLQNYSFQELLIDNNIVIIEPIRSNVKYEPHKSRTTRNVTQLLHKSDNLTSNPNANLRRHFFYHPIRVNREVNDDELPNPDTVKQVRQFFEGGLKRSQSSKNLEEITKQAVQYSSLDPDKDRCSTTDTNSSTLSDYGSNENLFESLDELCCDNQYVSEDILERIREHGTSVTYYGGRVLNKRNGKSSGLTKAIMDEIRRNSSRSSDCNCRKNSGDNKHAKSVTFAAGTNGNKTEHSNGSGTDTYQGIKFKLLKSNSCSSRLELLGTKNLSAYRDKYLGKQKDLIDDYNKKKQEEEEQNRKENNYIEVTTISLKKCNNKQSRSDREGTKVPADGSRNVVFQMDKNNVNNQIKRQDSDRSPKIIAEEIKTPEKKMTQWSEISSDRTYTKKSQKINYDYHNLDKVKHSPEKGDDMEFEPYEIAGN